MKFIIDEEEKEEMHCGYMKITSLSDIFLPH